MIVPPSTTPTCNTQWGGRLHTCLDQHQHAYDSSDLWGMLETSQHGCTALPNPISNTIPVDHLVPLMILNLYLFYISRSKNPSYTFFKTRSHTSQYFSFLSVVVYINLTKSNMWRKGFILPTLSGHRNLKASLLAVSGSITYNHGTHSQRRLTGSNRFILR